jgi:solute carrier family 9 (sodium/hydrogen exchanger), member 6/7
MTIFSGLLIWMN